MLPIVTMVVAALLSIEPLRIDGDTTLTPAFTLMATYHWTIYRPDLLPGLALFVIGTIQDLLSGGLPGVTAVTLLLARAIVSRHRHYLADQPFPRIWAGFTLLAGAAALFVWALHSLLARQVLDVRGAVFNTVLTIAIFPVASILLGRSRRPMTGAD